MSSDTRVNSFRRLTAVLLGLFIAALPTVMATSRVQTTSAASSTGFVSVNPARLLDTRAPESTVDGLFANDGIRVAGSTTQLVVLGRADVAANAQTAVLNVTVADPKGPGFVTVYPCGHARPLASNVNFGGRTTVANAVLARVGTSGMVCLYTSQAVSLVVDVTGYFTLSSGYVSLDPSRLMDSRAAGQTIDGAFAGLGLRDAGTVTSLTVSGRGGIPTNASAVMLSVTATNSVALGYVTVFACGSSRPTTSTINLNSSSAVSNPVLTEVGEFGSVCLYVSQATDLVIDVTGFLQSNSAVVPLRPKRLFSSQAGGSTVDGNFANAGLVPEGSVIKLVVADRGEVSVASFAAILNLTATDADYSGFVTVFTCGSNHPLSSNLNFSPSQAVANLAIAKLGLDGTVCIYVSRTINLIVDVTGYFPIGGPEHTPTPQPDAVTIPVVVPTSMSIPSVPGSILGTGDSTTTSLLQNRLPTSTQMSMPTGATTNPTLKLPTTSTSLASSTSSTSSTSSATPSSSTTAPSTSFPDIASNFDPSPWSSIEGGIPVSTASEPTGNFRLICHVSHYAQDDPIVFPSQAGASHMHMFFGNTLTSASSSWASLRSTGGGTCNGGPLNRSAYWAPALLNGAKNMITPDFITVYYKDGGAAQVPGDLPLSPFPNGLKMIGGFDKANPNAPTQWWWSCVAKQIKTTTIPTNCATGDQLEAFVSFPSCWDGVNLDSPTHRSHLAYRAYGTPDNRPHCPAGYPVSVPHLEIGFFWTVVAGDDLSTWSLTSDAMWGTPNGASLHADWIGAWDKPTMNQWVSACINAERNCQDGQLGDGRRMKSGPPSAFPRLVGMS